MFFSYHAIGQIIVDDPELSREPIPGCVSYGGVFTPKGHIRALIIFVTYDSIFSTMPVDDWAPGEARPVWASGQNKVFYTDLSEFNPTKIYADPDYHSVSNYYYQMSQGQFKLTADYYPRTICVHADTSDGWGDIHKKVIDTIAATDRGFDWSRYDLRKNNPNYQVDNSQSLPDDTIDLIAFYHRFSKTWKELPSPKLSDFGTADGFAGIKVGTYAIPGTPYIASDGITIRSGGLEPMTVFVHEVGHLLYNGPHTTGQNDEAGKYFYLPAAGWGMMTPNTYRSALAWERFCLDWIPSPNASGVNANFVDASDMPDSIVLNLRDFITTGDAVRVRMPGKRKQCLWLEYHAGASTFDVSRYGSTFCGESIAPIKKGLVAYVEKYSYVYEDSICPQGIANAIRWIHSDGNYDFSFSGGVETPSVYCNQNTYRLHKGAANSIGGQNVGEYIRNDYDGNDTIVYSIGNSLKRNEQTPVILLNDDDATPHHFTGTGITFPEGQKVGISYNPCVVNLAEFTTDAPKTIDDLYLNGISFRVLEYTNNVARVELRTNDYKIEQPTRWAAPSIVLTNLSSDTSADMIVAPGITLTIDKSGTPNRYLAYSDAYNERSFSDYTKLHLRDSSLFRQRRGSTVNVCDGSTLSVESGSVYEVGSGAILNIQEASTLHIQNGGTLRIKGNGHVEIQDGAYICVSPGGRVELQDTLSFLNLRNGHQISRNPVIYPRSGSCNNMPTYNQRIQTFDSDEFIQNTTISKSTSFAGRVIYAGYNITQQKPVGNVVVLPGSHVVLDAETGVHIKPGVEVRLGAALEIR